MFTLWSVLLCFRLLSVVVVQSWFVPDELYQSCEVAHNLIFGSGHLSWEWQNALRSVLHPSMIAVIYKFLQLLSLDSPFTVYYGPRVLHAFLFSLGDISFYNFCKRIVQNPVRARLSFITYLSCWFIFYCAPRTLSNSLETFLTLIALNWYPIEGRRYHGAVWPYILLGTLTIVIRPTAALIWVVFGLYHLFTSTNPVALIIVTVIPTVLPVLVASTLLDTLFCGHFTSSMWNFLSFNVLEGGSAHFGVHPWHWYFTSGILSVLTVQVIPIAVGCVRSCTTRVPLFVSIVYILFHSCLPHKEQRFLLPILPFLCVYAGDFFSTSRVISYRKKAFLYFMIAFNIILAVYTGLRHQVGPFGVSHFIVKTSQPPSNILSLLPCYSIPGHSYYHDRVDVIRQLDCSPDLNGTNKVDEADFFHSDPQSWLLSHSLDVYSHIFVYEKTFTPISKLSLFDRFTVCDRSFHSDFLTSSREDHYLLVLCRM